MLSIMFVRFETATANSRGTRPGVFALANGLAHEGKLSADDYAWWRLNNDWMNAVYTDPSQIDRTLFDRSIHPSTECWFKASAEHLIVRVRQYLSFLHRHGVGWVERLDDNPGDVLYEDEVQNVVIPFPQADPLTHLAP